MNLLECGTWIWTFWENSFWGFRKNGWNHDVVFPTLFTHITLHLFTSSPLHTRRFINMTKNLQFPSANQSITTWIHVEEHIVFFSLSDKVCVNPTRGTAMVRDFLHRNPQQQWHFYHLRLLPANSLVEESDYLSLLSITSCASYLLSLQHSLLPLDVTVAVPIPAENGWYPIDGIHTFMFAALDAVALFVLSSDPWVRCPFHRSSAELKKKIYCSERNPLYTLFY